MTMVMTRGDAYETARAARDGVAAARRAFMKLRGLPSLQGDAACAALLDELRAALRDAGDNASALVGALRPPEAAGAADPDELREAAREAAWW